MKDSDLYCASRGGVLLVVRAEGMMIERAAAILQRHGAVNIDQRAEY